MKLIKTQETNIKIVNTSKFERIISYICYFLPISFFFMFNALRYNFTKPNNSIFLLISIYEYLVISINIIVFIIVKFYYKKYLTNPYVLIPCNYFFSITSLLLNISLIVSLFSKSNNEKLLIENITLFRAFILAGILDSMFILSVINLISYKKVKLKIYIIFIIALYGSLSLNLFVFKHPKAQWPNVQYNSYIIYLINLILLYYVRIKNNNNLIT